MRLSQEQVEMLGEGVTPGRWYGDKVPMPSFIWVDMAHGPQVILQVRGDGAVSAGQMTAVEQEANYHLAIRAPDLLADWLEMHAEISRLRREDDQREALALTIGAMAKGFDDELFTMSQDELKEQWFFTFDPDRRPSANLYGFYDMLKIYASSCRRWEEHHNGSCCVVERVRDTYLMPKIREFIAQDRAALEGRTDG